MPSRGPVSLFQIQIGEHAPNLPVWVPFLLSNSFFDLSLSSHILPKRLGETRPCHRHTTEKSPPLRPRLFTPNPAFHKPGEPRQLLRREPGLIPLCALRDALSHPHSPRGLPGPSRRFPPAPASTHPRAAPPVWVSRQPPASQNQNRDRLTRLP